MPAFFILIGIYLLITPPDAGTTLHPYAIKGFGSTILLFFGIMAFMGAKKLFDPTPALIIDGNGVTDNTTPAAVGFIPWKDVAGIRKYDMLPEEFIVINLKNPDDYIEELGNLKVKWIKKHIDAAGSPVVISSNTVRYNFLILENLITTEFNKHQNLN